MAELTKREQFALAIYCASIQSPELRAITANGEKALPVLAVEGADSLMAQLAKTAPVEYRNPL